MPSVELSAATTLPADGLAGALVGRVWRPDVDGPSVVVARDDGARRRHGRLRHDARSDRSGRPRGGRCARRAGERLGAIDEILANTPPDRRDPGRPWLHRADRPAGDQGRRRHLRDLAARTGDRGAGARRARRRGDAIRGDFTRRVGDELASIASPARRRRCA